MENDKEWIRSRLTELKKRVGMMPVLLLETFQNWGETQKMTVISVKPKTVDEVQKIVTAINSYNSVMPDKISLRCVGEGHSWSPLFADEGNVLMRTSQLLPKTKERIRLVEDDGSCLKVTIAPGVTTGELSKFFTENNVCLESNAIIGKVTYGGLIAPGCHGVGKDQLAISDYVKGMTIVGADAEEKEFKFPSEKQDLDNALKCNMGLFGVITSITMEVQPMFIVQVENDFSHTVGDLFNKSEELENLHKNNWSLEIFWIPFNSLNWLQLLSLGFLPFHHLPPWNANDDRLWIRKINLQPIPTKPTPNEVEYYTKQVQDLVSTGFARTVAPNLKKAPFLIPSFLKAGFEMLERFNTETRDEPINKAIHYQNFIEAFPVLDMEFAFNADPGTFSEQVKAIKEVIQTTQDYYSQKKFPLSVAMEMRWMAYSDCLICPAHAVHAEKKEGIQTLYLEVLGLAGQEDWQEYTNHIACKWMEMKINGKVPLPHWAKQWTKIDGIDDHIQKGYGDSLTKFRKQVPDGAQLLFSNAMLNKVIFQDPEKEIFVWPNVMKMKGIYEFIASTVGSWLSPSRENVQPKIKQSNSTVKAPESDTPKEEYQIDVPNFQMTENAWKTFFQLLAEQVWNVPFKRREMDLQKEWERTCSVLKSEIPAKNPNLSIDEDLFKSLFTGAK